MNAVRQGGTSLMMAKWAMVAVAFLGAILLTPNGVANVKAAFGAQPAVSARPEPPFQPNSNIETPVNAQGEHDPALVATWRLNGQYMVVFKSDGTYIVPPNSPLKWKTSQGKLTLYGDPKDDTFQMEGPYSASGASVTGELLRRGARSADSFVLTDKQ